MKHKIRFILLLLAMTPLSIWAQSDGYNPANPGDPETPQRKYLVSVKAEPSNSGSFSINNERYAAGTILYINAYPNTGFKMRQWVIGDSIVPNSTSLTYTVPERASEIVAQFVYDPDSPENPSKNYWNQETGEVIVDDFTSGNLASSISQAIKGASYNDVLKITVAGKIANSDFNVLNYFSQCKLLDMSRATGISQIPSYAFYNKNVESIYLPDNIEQIGNYAFAYSKQLSSIMLNATTPPDVTEDAFYDVCDTIAIYVPETALPQYQDHEVWSKLNLKPFTPAYSRIKLQGDIVFTEDSTYRFIHKDIEPAWRFSNPEYAQLREGVDYYVAYADNYYPGTATLTVVGTGDYTGKLQNQFVIEKGFLPANQYRIELPDSTITYDGKEHQATAYGYEGVGDIIITYQKEGEAESVTTAPMEEGVYDVYAEITDGKYYLGKEKEKVGTFQIFKMDEKEWQMLMAMNETLSKMGMKKPWDMSQGIASITKLSGVTVKSGHITGLDLSNQELKGELPLTALAFPQLEKLNLSHNALTGNIGLLGKAAPTLKSLNASYNAFTDVMPMLPATIKDLDISHQTIDRTIVLDASNYNVATILAQMPTILAYDHQNQTFNTTNLACLLTTSEGPDWYDKWAVMLKLSNGNLTMPYVTTPSEYIGQSGDILHLVKLNNDWANSMDGSNLKVQYIFPQGDANFKPGVDATDVQATVLYAFGEYIDLPFNFTAADTYTDGQINVQDVICTVNLVLGEAVSQARTYQDIGSKAYQQNVLETSQQNNDAKAHIYLQDGKVVLSTEVPIAALCIKASGKITWNLNQPGMEQATQQTNLVGYSLCKATLPVGKTVIGTYTGDANIWDINLSDSNAEAIPATIARGTSTGIKNISVVDKEESEDKGQQPETFNLQGIKTSKMQKGINIVKKNGKIHKVIKQ